tara:strand:+ start:1793 stop:2335 length:543 start_codon:yes stop_codon:yes gene_type:complete
MNLFALDEMPEIAALLHCDKHVCKMIIEYAQLMSTAHRVLDGSLYYDKTKNGSKIKRWRLDDIDMEDVVYKASHINHPSAIWTRENDSNYTWVYTLWVSLCREYTHRYGRTHETYRKLATVLNKLPQNIPAGEKTEIPQCMPEDAKRDNVVEAYQEYYRKYKSDFAKWTDREVPEFMNAA